MVDFENCWGKEAITVGGAFLRMRVLPLSPHTNIKHERSSHYEIV